MTREFAVEARQLTVKFGAFTAVDRVSFEVSQGEIFGFLGANGAGKTTTIRVLCGLITPTQGDVRVAGKSFADGERAIKEKVGYMSQKFTLYDDLTIEENLEFSAALHKLEKSIYLKRQKELFEFVSFDRPIASIVRELPGGTKQQVSLVASLLHDPEIVFLDEPTAGVSPASRARFWTLIKKISSAGKTVFVTTHYMDEAEQCGRIALMREGKIIALDTPAELKRKIFPQPMFEFDPKEGLNFSEIAQLSREPVFSFFEPYGLRFHASVESPPEWEKERPRFEKMFKIRTITPTLEDVFIQTVEGHQK